MNQRKSSIRQKNITSENYWELKKIVKIVHSPRINIRTRQRKFVLKVLYLVNVYALTKVLHNKKALGVINFGY